MIPLALVLVPAVAGGAAYFLRSGRARSAVLLGCGVIHVFLSPCSGFKGSVVALSGWLAETAWARRTHTR